MAGGRGGAREGSGRKPKFESDDGTTNIRVPKRLKEEAEQLIRELDKKWAREHPD